MEIYIQRAFRHLMVLLFFLFSVQLFAQEPTLSSTYYLDNDGQGEVFVHYTIPDGYHQILNESFFTFTTDTEDFTLSAIEYPPTTDYDLFEGYEGVVTLRADLTYTGDDSETPMVINARYQLCDDQGVCLRPMASKVSSTAVEAPVQFPLPPSGQKGTALFLLFAFLGGVLLNIMPCVLPVLSIKALSLVNQSQEDHKKILLNSLSYSAGILFSMLVLAITVLSIKASGTLLGWGFQFQNPSFVLILTSIVFLFALSLFEIFFINSPQTAGKVSQKQKNRGYHGSFVTGIMAVLLATPCTAPLLGSALGFAFSQDGPIILLFFSLIGLGLALPFILLGIFPGLIKMLPKTGDWMNRFREVMGFLLLGTVVHLLTTLHVQLGDHFKGILWFLLVLAFSAWIYGRAQRSSKVKRYILMLLSVGLFVSGALFFVDLTPGEKGSLSHGEDLAFSPEAVETLRAEGTPLFLEFTADWCSTCSSNHLTVLDRDFRVDLFDKFNVTYMVGDYTLEDPVIAQWLKANGRAGVPLYIYYPPGEEGIILPEILTRPILERTIGKD